MKKKHTQAPSATGRKDTTKRVTAQFYRQINGIISSKCRSLRLSLTEVSSHDGVFVVHGETTGSSACCPCCGHPSHHVHVHRLRKIQCTEQFSSPVTLILRIRHFRCENPSCPQKYFAEPLPLAGRYARMSREVASRVLEESLFQPSRSACETLRRQHISVSRSTCLRMANRQGCRNPEVPTSGYVGIDDFASRKGRIYMSAVVDHYTHQPVAVFNSRYGCEIAEWLRSHPEIKLVTRDGSQAYAEIIRSASPSIQQVADRFHLMKNLKEVAVDLVKDMLGQRRRPQELPYPDEAEAYECIVGDICRMGEARHRQKVRQCMQARRLRDEGQTMAEMAEALGVNTQGVHTLAHRPLETAHAGAKDVHEDGEADCTYHRREMSHDKGYHTAGRRQAPAETHTGMHTDHYREVQGKTEDGQAVQSGSLEDAQDDDICTDMEIHTHRRNRLAATQGYGQGENGSRRTAQDMHRIPEDDTCREGCASAGAMDTTG